MTLLRLSAWLRVENQLAAGQKNGNYMESQRMTRRLSAVAGGLAIVALAGLTASCATQAPPTASGTDTPTTTTTTSAAFTTPPVIATPAPTAIPGATHH
jgi:hypothetical protein